MQADAVSTAEERVGDRYVVRELLAEGGASSVYRAEDVVLKVDRAVKVLSRVADREPGMRGRFEREAQVLARLRHPNVVSVHDLGTWNGRPCMVMDLLPGGSLEARLAADGPFPPERATELLRGVLDALGAVHAEGIVHRDVKPANILLDARGAACLTDFGIARVLDDVVPPTATGSRLGTFAYMAPEQLDDPRSVDARADVFAAGATLFALLTGDPPFGLLDAERRDGLLARVPEPLRAVVEKATSSNRDGRYLGVADMAAALPRVAAPRSRRPAWAGVGGTVLGAVLGAGLMFGLSARPESVEPVVQPDEVLAAPAVVAPPVVEAPVVEAPSAPVEPSGETVSAAAVREPTPRDPRTEARPKAEARTPVRAPVPEVAPATPTVVEPAKGTLVVNAQPWSELSLDGRPVGRTPWTGTVTAEAHTLGLTSSEGGSERTVSVTVPKGVTTVYCWDHRTGAPCSR